MSVGYLAGLFDLVNVRDLDLINQARAGCARLVLGVFTDGGVGLRPLDGRRMMIPEGLSTGPGGWGDRKSAEAAPLTVGYVPGAWDMFHIGHLNILLRAREQCDHLVAGVVTDEALQQAKGKLPVIPLAERLEMIRSLRLSTMSWSTSPPTSSRSGSGSGSTSCSRATTGGAPEGRQARARHRHRRRRVIYFPYTVHTSSTLLRSLLTQH